MTMDVKIAWRNCWRHPRRSILTVCAIAFATLLLVFMLSWQFGSYATMINSAVRIHTGHLQVQARGYQDNKDIRLVVSNPRPLLDILGRTPGVAAHAPRARAFSLVSSRERTYGAMVVGVDPAMEAKVSRLAKTIRRGRYLSAEDGDRVLIGSLLAENLRVGPGDEVVLLGQGLDGSIAATVLKVKGIFSSGQDEFDRRVLFIPLDYFQDVYAMRGAVHEVAAVGESLGQVPEIKAAVAASIEDLPAREDLVVLDWRELMPGLIQAIQMDLVSGLIFYVILIVVVAFSILNTFLMAIFERTREFGVMLAMGAPPSRLAGLLLIESASITFVGAAAGVIVGSLITRYFQMHGILLPGAAELVSQYGLPERMFPKLSVLSVSLGAGLVLVITLLTAMYPVLKVRRLRPVEAMAAV